MAEGAREIRLINRTRAKAEALAEDMGGVVQVLDWEQREAALEGCALLVNTTNQGMYGQPPLDIRLDALPLSAMVSDLIYIPLETPLLEAARLRGHQTVPAFEAWFGVKPEITGELRQAILATFQ